MVVVVELAQREDGVHDVVAAVVRRGEAPGSEAVGEHVARPIAWRRRTVLAT
jgi:hypothetical protein